MKILDRDRQTRRLEKDLRHSRPTPAESFVRGLVHRTPAVRASRWGRSVNALTLAPLVAVVAAVAFLALQTGVPRLQIGSPFAAANVAYLAPSCTITKQGNHPR